MHGLRANRLEKIFKSLYLLVLGVGCQLLGQELSGELVTLPSFQVTDTRILPTAEQWRYAQVPGFEILSSASDSTSRDVIQDFLRFHRAVEVLWPMVRMNASVDASIILCDTGSRVKAFVPSSIIRNAQQTVSLSLEDHEHAAIVINLGAARSENNSVGSSKLVHHEYVHFLVNRIGPRTPDWLRFGLEAMFDTLAYTENRVGLPAISDMMKNERVAFNLRLNQAIKEGVSIRAFASKDVAYQSMLKEGIIIPLHKLFILDQDTNTQSSDWNTEQATKESRAFIEFCLLGSKAKYREAFMKFAYLSSRSRSSEDLFKQCFSTGYEEMTALFWANTEMLSDRGFELIDKQGKVVADIAKLNLHDATDAQSSRIRAEAQRMAGRTEDGRQSLIAAYLRGQRDPELLSALGLAEHVANKDTRALIFLKRATNENTKSARAYLQLAQIQMKLWVSAPGQQKLGVDRVAILLKLLFKAKSLNPPLPEVYEAIASVWRESSVEPSRGHLQVLDQGLVLFPYDSELFLLDAQLYTRIGYLKDALQLCKIGLSWSTDVQSRSELIKLKASLEAKIH